MKVIVLSSGSKGNTTYIETQTTKILIDIGNTCKYITEKLSTIGVTLGEINAILITHTHTDHIKGLKTFTNNYSAPIYITEKMHPKIPYVKQYKYIESSLITIRDIKINIIKTSHDAEDSVGYIINNNDKSIVYITDTGYINKKYHPMLSNRDIYIMESNHDVEMLNNGPYPFPLRQRILSDKGHLSNHDSAKYICDFIGPKTTNIVLAHLSHENNTPELAKETLLAKLQELNMTQIHIDIALQDQETEIIQVW